MALSKLVRLAGLVTMVGSVVFALGTGSKHTGTASEKAIEGPEAQLWQDLTCPAMSIASTLCPGYPKKSCSSGARHFSGTVSS